MLVLIIAVFIIGYLAIVLEHQLRCDKASSALLLGTTLWVLYALFCDQIVPVGRPEELLHYIQKNNLEGLSLREQCLQYILNVDIIEHLGDIAQTLFFLIGAMTIVELIDIHEGFTVLTDRITTRDKRLLMIVVCTVTFFFSAVLDNLTTTIVMVMLLRQLIKDKNERWIFASMVVIAANTGGAWSPIGDVTTIMLWVKGNVTTGALISYVLFPSLVALLVPLAIVLPKLKGRFPKRNMQDISKRQYTDANHRFIFIAGVGGLLLVPIIKEITHLPPFIGVLFVLGVLWVLTEIFYNKQHLEKAKEHRLARVIKRIDMSTILFFFGILMAVAVLQSAGILATVANALDQSINNVYATNMLLGVFSSIVDNVPLVAAAMGMYPVEAVGATGYAANFMVDGTFWEFLSYCAGVGGNLLIIGSAAGVIAMGMEKVSFGWYLKHFSLIALAGFLAGAVVYIIESEFLKGLFV